MCGSRWGTEKDQVNTKLYRISLYPDKTVTRCFRWMMRDGVGGRVNGRSSLFGEDWWGSGRVVRTHKGGIVRSAGG